MPIKVERVLFMIDPSKRDYMRLLKGYAQGVTRGMMGMLDHTPIISDIKVYMTLSLIRDLTSTMQLKNK
jgi:hypothetical protein